MNPTQTQVAPENYDCVVIGGGPAGSTVSTLIAKAGHSVLVLERAKFPRFHIGESLLPETYWVFEKMGILTVAMRVGMVLEGMLSEPGPG